jgi:hypothetical protein
MRKANPTHFSRHHLSSLRHLLAQNLLLTLPGGELFDFPLVLMMIVVTAIYC